MVVPHLDDPFLPATCILRMTYPGPHHAPKPALPHGACDCHTHVFLDPRGYPYAPGRRYTPPPASVAQLVALHERLGIERVVIVQPSVYGADNRATLQGLRALGLSRARGVAVLDDAMTETDLHAMHALGVRGVRVNLEVDHVSDSAHATAQLQRAAGRVAPLGWHVQLYASLPLIAACRATLRSLPVPVVFDHYAGARPQAGVDQAGLDAVLALIAEGQAYVKLSAPYRLAQRSDYADLQAVARQFIATRADRMLWGSDWPHPQPEVRDAYGISPPFEVDSGHVLQQLGDWTSDAATWRQILVDNPAHLYGFHD